MANINWTPAGQSQPYPYRSGGWTIGPRVGFNPFPAYLPPPGHFSAAPLNPASATFPTVPATVSVSNQRFAPTGQTSAALSSAIGYAPTGQTSAALPSAMGYAPTGQTSAALPSTIGYAPTGQTSAALPSAIGYAPTGQTSAALPSAIGYAHTGLRQSAPPPQQRIPPSLTQRNPTSNFPSRAQLVQHVTNNLVQSDYSRALWDAVMRLVEPENGDIPSFEELLIAIPSNNTQRGHQGQVNPHSYGWEDSLSNIENETRNVFLMPNYGLELVENLTRTFGNMLGYNSFYMSDVILLTSYNHPLLRRHKIETLSISKTQLANFPCQLLCSLHPLMQSNSTYIMIKFINDSGKVDKGADLGGLNREFLSKLFNGVAEEKNGPLTFENNLPLMKGDSLSLDEKRGYSAMGRLMGMCLTEPLLRTGSKFPPAFFSELKAINVKEAQNSDLNSTLNVFLALDPSKEKIVNCLRTNNFTKDALDWAFPDGIPCETDLSNDAIHSAIMNNLRVMKKAAPFFPLVQGLQRSLELMDKNWDAVRNLSFIALSQVIQGVTVSKENIGVTGPNTQQITFFKLWLNETSPELLELLVYAATGSTTLSESQQMIAIEPANKREQDLGALEFISCAGTIRIPQYKDYATFKRAFELSLEGFKNGGFTID